MNRLIFRLFIISIFSYSNAECQNIFRTACQGNIPRLDSLLAESEISATDSRGRSLLHWAVACNKAEVIDFLVDRNIPVNIMDNEGMTPMHMAIRFDKEVYMDQLIDVQENEDWKSQYGVSLIELAILKNKPHFIEKLVDLGIDINGTNNRGSTPLEISRRLRNTQMDSLLLALGANSTLVRNIERSGSYMGQELPSMEKKMFAPNFISTEESEFGSVFNEAGTEFFYGVDVNGRNEIRYSILENGIWTKPQILIAYEEYSYNDPFLSPDEDRLYFITNQPSEGKGPRKEDMDIYYVERSGNDWSDPISAGSNINTSDNEYYISFTENGRMYFASNVNAPEERKRSDLDIYYSDYEDGKFLSPQRLGPSINTEDYEADAYIDPKEQYMIFCSTRSDGLGRGDLYISYKEEDGSWTKSVNMGDQVNSIHHELCPFVSADGKYLFFTSDQDIYWISTDIITDIKNGLR